MVGLLKVSLLGGLPNGEVWSVNPVWELGTGDFDLTFTELSTIATAINAITIPTAIRAMQSVSTTSTGVRLEHRNVDGTLRAQLEQLRPAPMPGTGTVIHTLQQSAVASLRTATSGGSGRGRIYWPLTAGSLQAVDNRIAAGDVTSYLSGVKSYLALIQTAINATNANSDLVVWSRTQADLKPVNRILMGNVPDVQRRRRDTAIETYSQTAWP